MEMVQIKIQYKSLLLKKNQDKVLSFFFRFFSQNIKYLV